MVRVHSRQGFEGPYKTILFHGNRKPFKDHEQENNNQFYILFMYCLTFIINVYFCNFSQSQQKVYSKREEA